MAEQVEPRVILRVPSGCRLQAAVPVHPDPGPFDGCDQGGQLLAGPVVGDGAVVDYEFGTTDVLIVLPVSAIKQRYMEHFGDGRRAA